MLIPPTYWIKHILCHTDGSLTACSFVFFLVSEDHISAFCINVDAGSRIKDHSVPCNETSGLVLGLQSVASFIMNHYDNLASRIKSKLTVSFQIDSSCLGSWLSPYIVHKNVFVKNSSSKIHDLCTDISRDYDLEVNFSHVAGVGNIADFN